MASPFVCPGCAGALRSRQSFKDSAYRSPCRIIAQPNDEGQFGVVNPRDYFIG